MMNYGVASSSSWSNSLYNPELGITEIRGPFQDYCVPFKSEHLEQVQPSWHVPVSPKGELVHLDTPHDWLGRSGKVHQKNKS